MVKGFLVTVVIAGLIASWSAWMGSQRVDVVEEGRTELLNVMIFEHRDVECLLVREGDGVGVSCNWENYNR